MYVVEAPIEAERLRLRPYRLDDHDDVFAVRSDPELTRWTPLRAGTHEAVDELLAVRARNVRLAQDDDIVSLAAEQKSDGAFVGEMTFWLRSVEHRQGELGYLFRREAQGKGYATEASAALLRLGFETLGLHRIYATAYVANTASTAVMERLGMTREAQLRQVEHRDGVWLDDVTYSILEDEWRAREPAIRSA